VIYLRLFLFIFKQVTKPIFSMKNFTLNHFVCIICLFVLFSCKKDDPVNCSVAWATDLQNEITAISNATQAYFMDQSDENCNALKAAYQDYIDALKPYGNCTTLTGQDRIEWQNALNEAEDDIATMC